MLVAGGAHLHLVGITWTICVGIKVYTMMYKVIVIVIFTVETLPLKLTQIILVYAYTCM